MTEKTKRPEKKAPVIRRRSADLGGEILAILRDLPHGKMISSQEIADLLPRSLGRVQEFLVFLHRDGKVKREYRYESIEGVNIGRYFYRALRTTP